MFPGSVRFHVGDVVVMKKPHPCGSSEWEITRTGIDFGLRCMGCGRRVMVPRTQFERQVRKVARYAVETSPGLREGPPPPRRQG